MTAVRPWLAALIVVSFATLSSCHLIYPFDIGASALPDGAVDAAMVEASVLRDGLGTETPAPGDGPGLWDVGPGEAKPPQDQGSDADQGQGQDNGTPPPDLGPPLPDKGTPSKKPCAAGISQGTVWAADMVSCKASGKIDQCAAEALCNLAGGWALCTASQYRARGGQTKGSPDHGWLKACVRSKGGKPHAPTDDFCAATCSASGSKFAEVGWWCSDGKPQYDLPFLDVGVIATNLCWRVGVNNATTAAHWSPLATGSSGVSIAGVCCSP